MATLAQNIQRAIDDFNSIENAIVAKGVPVPDGTPTSEYGEKILSIETGVDTSGDTVVPSALREGYTAHDAAGQEITGTIPNYDGGDTVELTSPEGATLNTAGTYCEGNIEVVPKLQSKTVTTGEIVTADEGYVGLESVDTTGVFEAGKTDEAKRRWDEAIKIPQSGFSGASWNDETFIPFSDFNVKSNISFMFAYSLITGSLQERIEEAGYKVGIIRAFGSCSNVFAYSKLNRIPEIRFNVDALYSVFVWSNLQTIDKIVLEKDGITFSATFNECHYLEHMIIEGTIGQNDFNVSWSPLNKASLVSIVNALSSTTTGLTVTLRLAAVNTAFETSAGAADGSTSEEWTALIATKPNWTINLINS